MAGYGRCAAALLLIGLVCFTGTSAVSAAAPDKELAGSSSSRELKALSMELDAMSMDAAGESGADITTQLRYIILAGACTDMPSMTFLHSSVCTPLSGRCHEPHAATLPASTIASLVRLTSRLMCLELRRTSYCSAVLHIICLLRRLADHCTDVAIHIPPHVQTVCVSRTCM
jgi:hypothetical protein